MKVMRSTFLVIVFLGLTSSPFHEAIGQGTVYAQWLNQAESTSACSGDALDVDFNTNVYVLGTFPSSTSIAGSSLTNTSGLPNFFLTKFLYNSAAPAVWAVAPQTDGAISNPRLAVAAIAGSLVAGNFNGTNLSFGATTLTNSASDHTDDIFVMEFDAGGNLVWALQTGGTSSDVLGDIKVDHHFPFANGFFLTGSFDSPNFLIGGTNLALQGTTDCFVAKGDLNGSLVWLKQGSFARGRCLALDGANNCYVGGDVLGPTSFNGISPSNQIGTNFLAKYDAGGNLMWIRGDVTVGDRIEVDRSQNIYTVGSFSNSINIGSITLSNHSPSTVYLAKYDSDGNALWAHQLSGRGFDAGLAITIDVHMNCWIGGYFASTNSDGKPLDPQSFIACYSENGDLFAISEPNQNGTSITKGLGNSIGPNGFPINTFACGSFSNKITFGSRSVTNITADAFATWIFPRASISAETTQTNLVVSWPASISVGFTLQSSTDPTLENWSTATNEVYSVNGLNIITNDISQGTRFFRLRSAH